MLTVDEVAKKWRVSAQRVRQWCIAGRIVGAEKFGPAWAIPKGAKRPKKLKPN